MNQKSYNESKYGKLYLIPTPIGNLQDITIRAIEILKEVDYVFAEDTRQTKILLDHYSINKKIESCHKYSEMKNKDKIINLLKNGKTLAYVSDRGTPLISDPGSIIVEEAIKNDICVISLPGPNALLPAINMSGISNEKFLFYGFLNSKKSLAKKELLDLKELKYTIIFYESPYRIKDTLELMLNVLGNRNISIVREISKIHEEIIRKKIDAVLSQVENIKGEIVIIVEGNNSTNDSIDYIEYVNNLINNGYSRRDAIREVSDRFNVKKNELYDKIK